MLNMWEQRTLVITSIIVLNVGLTSATCKATCSVVNQRERIVKCSGRQITCIPTVGIHPQTRELVLENNLLTELTRNSFSHLPNLETLVLSSNHITSIEPGAFNDLQRLEALYLRQNKLQRIPIGALAGMPKLKILDLAHNNIESIENGALRPMKSLVHLYLSANRLTDISDNILSGLGNVRLISFLSNDISSVSEKAFDGLLRLQTVYLGNNKLQTFPNILNNARSLVSIGLENNPLKCDCQMEYLRVWLRARMTSRRMPTTSPVRCSSPALLKDEDLRTITFRLKCMKPNITSADTNIMARVQNNVMMKCEATGSPLPSISWTLPPRVSQAQVKVLPGGRLSINAAQASHTGEYICLAKSVAGEAKKHFKLDVLCDCNTCGKRGYPSADDANVVVGQEGDHNVDPCAADYSMVHVSLAGVFITIAITFVLTFLLTAVFLTYWFRKHSNPVHKHTNLNNTTSCSSAGSSSTLSSSERRLLPLPQNKNGMTFPCIARYYTPPKMATSPSSKYRHRKLVTSISDNTYSSMYSSMCIGNDEYTYVHNRANDGYDYDYRDLGHIYAGANEVVRYHGHWNSLPMYANREEDGGSVTANNGVNGSVNGRGVNSSGGINNSGSVSGIGGGNGGGGAGNVGGGNGGVLGGRSCALTETDDYACLELMNPEIPSRPHNHLNKL